MSVFFKITVFLVILFVNGTFSVLTEKQVQQTGKAMASACKASSGVQRSLVMKAAQGELTDDRKLKCFFACVFETLQVIKNGKLYPELLRKRATTMLPTEIREAILPTIEYCGSIENEDKCELAYSLVDCHFQVSGGKNEALDSERLPRQMLHSKHDKLELNIPFRLTFFENSKKNSTNN